MRLPIGVPYRVLLFLYNEVQAMLFHLATKGKELPYISQLLSIFGIVEARQMRLLFSHLTDYRYGKIMARLHQEGMIYYESGGRYLCSRGYTLDPTRMQGSIRAFWVLIKLKDKAKGIFAGDPPALLSFSTGNTDYDMVPVNTGDLEKIAICPRYLPKDVRRLLIVSSMDETDGFAFRPQNDYVVEVSEDGDVQMYKM